MKPVQQWVLPHWNMGGELCILVITPAHNEAHNLLELHGRIATALEATQWCWLLVDDRSDDDTFAIADVLSRQDEWVAAIRFGVRVGTHAAILAALQLAARWGFAAAAVLGADLEDPAEALPDLISASPWSRGRVRGAYEANGCPAAAYRRGVRRQPPRAARVFAHMIRWAHVGMRDERAATRQPQPLRAPR